MKIRHILFIALALLAIAFLQPLITFLGGVTMLLGVGGLIYRDLSPQGQEAIEHWLLGWLRRARTASVSLPVASRQLPLRSSTTTTSMVEPEFPTPHQHVRTPSPKRRPASDASANRTSEDADRPTNRPKKPLSESPEA